MKPLDEKDSKVPPSLIIAQITVRGHLASSLSVSCCCQDQADWYKPVQAKDSLKGNTACLLAVLRSWQMLPLSRCGRLWSCRTPHVAYERYIFLINSRCAIPSFPPPPSSSARAAQPTVSRFFFLFFFFFCFPLCLNQVQIGGKRMTDNLCPTCSYTKQARTSYRERHIELKSQMTAHFGRNRAEGQFWICLWLSLTNLRARSSWVVLAARSSEKIYLDGWQLLYHSSRLLVSP